MKKASEKVEKAIEELKDMFSYFETLLQNSSKSKIARLNARKYSLKVEKAMREYRILTTAEDYHK